MSTILRRPNIEPVQAEALLDLLPDFYEDRAAKGASEKTITNYQYHLAPFVQWFESHAPAFDYQLTPQRLREFATWMATGHTTQYGAPMAHNSQAVTLKRLRSVLTWLYKSGYCDRNVSGWVPVLTETAREPRTLNIDRMVLLFEAAIPGRPSLTLRDWALLALMFGTGARVMEISEILRENITFHEDDSGSIHLVVTKGNKPRTVIFGPTCGAFLRSFLKTRPPNDGPLFDFKSRGTVNTLLRRLTCRADIDRISSHDTRKFFVSYWYSHHPIEEGFDKHLLKMQIGHTSRDVTHKHYVRLETKTILRYYVSPLEEKAEELRDLLTWWIDVGQTATDVELEARDV